MLPQTSVVISLVWWSFNGTFKLFMLSLCIIHMLLLYTAIYVSALVT